MIEKDIQMKNDVMNRVKSIHYMRTVIRPMFVKASLLLIAVVAISSLVSIPNIIINMTQSQKDYVSYIFEAFLQTKLVVQVGLLAAMLLLGLLIQDIVKNLKYIREFNFSKKRFT